MAKANGQSRAKEKPGGHDRSLLQHGHDQYTVFISCFRGHLDEAADRHPLNQDFVLMQLSFRMFFTHIHFCAYNYSTALDFSLIDPNLFFGQLEMQRPFNVGHTLLHLMASALKPDPAIIVPALE